MRKVKTIQETGKDNLSFKIGSELFTIIIYMENVSKQIDCTEKKL